MAHYQPVIDPATTTFTINHLPPDCLIEIFQYLPFLPSVLNLQLVSSAWRNTVQHFIARGGFDLNLGFLPSHVTLSKFIMIIGRFYNAKQITLCNLQLTVDLMKVLSFTAIETLVLCNCSTEAAVSFSPDLVSSGFKQFKDFQREMNEKLEDSGRLPFYNLKRVIVIDSSTCLNFVWKEDFIEDNRDESCQASLKSFYNLESGFDNCWNFKSISMNSNKRVSFLALELYNGGDAKSRDSKKFVTLKSGKTLVNIPIQPIEYVEDKKALMFKYGLKSNYRKVKFNSKTLQQAIDNFLIGIYSYTALEDFLTLVVNSPTRPMNFVTDKGFYSELIYFLHKYQILRENSNIPLRIVQLAETLDYHWASFSQTEPVSTKTENISEEIPVPFSWVHLLKKGQYIHLPPAQPEPEKKESTETKPVRKSYRGLLTRGSSSNNQD
ncbi:F-box domain-containing protein [Naegleria gruberi]|uniref:F-box domain-containing protein n=1 Tax=Naegleria gruberi TaxID=5762 RepID=D2VLX4_NAEGR|nr:F-box domain-containing protein [Naegleria gruberi]EFC42130.1 F-box domain-containing protein [Naegleria gruberi]|eukprot:XP_002674874.1 F-box domain-containing protein [Naegleria gruberi strain NEG-M]